mgnify:FL=1
MKKFNVNITKAQVKSFLKASAPVVLQLTIMMLPAAIAFASNGDAGGAAAAGQSSNTVGITPLDKPLQTVTNALTGPIPILVTGCGVALAGMSWAMGWEQQVMMRGVKAAGGGAVAMGAGSFMQSVIGTGLTTGCLF